MKTGMVESFRWPVQKFGYHSEVQHLDIDQKWRQMIGQEIHQWWYNLLQWRPNHLLYCVQPIIVRRPVIPEGIDHDWGDLTFGKTVPGLSDGTIWKKIVSPTILSSSSVETIEKLASVKYSRSKEKTPVAAVPACAALFVIVA